MTDCPNATVRDRLPDLLHGALDATTRAAVEAHVAGCADCTSELALLRAARGALARAPEVDVARIVAALPRPAVARPRLVEFPSAEERERRAAGRHATPWGGLAAAAVVAVAIGLGSLVVRDRPAEDGAAVVALADSGERGAASGAPAAPTARASRPTATSAAAAPLLVVNTSGLSDADLAGLLDELDDLDAVPAADPMSLVPMGELPGDAGSGL